MRVYLDSGGRGGVKFLFVNIGKMMQEYDLEIDDVRWYLACLQADRLLGHRNKKRDLVRLIWSGELEGALYDMEERFLGELQARLDGGTRDEIQVRGVLREVVSCREKRYTVE